MSTVQHLLTIPVNSKWLSSVSEASQQRRLTAVHCDTFPQQRAGGLPSRIK